MLRSILCAVCLTGFANAGTQSDAASLWNDPVFQKQFIASYGINSEIEPRVTPDELKLLEKVRPLMATDLPQAESILKKAIKPGSSAILDFDLASLQAQQDRLKESLENYRRAVEK